MNPLSSDRPEKAGMLIALQLKPVNQGSRRKQATGCIEGRGEDSPDGGEEGAGGL